MERDIFSLTLEQAAAWFGAWNREWKERESCCEERQPLAMWVFPQVFGPLTLYIFRKILNLYTVVSVFIEFFKNITHPDNNCLL